MCSLPSSLWHAEYCGSLWDLVHDQAWNAGIGELRILATPRLHQKSLGSISMTETSYTSSFEPLKIQEVGPMINVVFNLLKYN